MARGRARRAAALQGQSHAADAVFGKALRHHRRGDRPGRRLPPSRLDPPCEQRCALGGAQAQRGSREIMRPRCRADRSGRDQGEISAGRSAGRARRDLDRQRWLCRSVFADHGLREGRAGRRREDRRGRDRHRLPPGERAHHARAHRPWRCRLRDRGERRRLVGAPCRRNGGPRTAGHGAGAPVSRHREIAAHSRSPADAA